MTLGSRLAPARRLGGRAIRAVGRSLGFTVLRQHYYSPIPDVRALPASLWNTPRELHGIAWDLERQFALLEGELAPALAEAAQAVAPDGSLSRIWFDNLTYGSVDTEILYAWIRHLRPRRVVELGSGISTLVIDAALRRNGTDGPAGGHRVFDPTPWLDRLVSSGVRIERTSATDVPLAVFSGLESGDVLFVDTSHAVRVGGDVIRIVLEALPVLAEGVIVHFHDIYLPWEYPRALLADLELFWTEQHLLQAFLAFNERFEVLLGAHALARAAPERLRALMPSLHPGANPTAMWLRRAPDGKGTGTRGVGPRGL